MLQNPPRPPTPPDRGLPASVRLQVPHLCAAPGLCFPIGSLRCPSKQVRSPPCPAPPASSLSLAGLWRLGCSRVGQSGQCVQSPGPWDRSGAWVRAGLFGDRLPGARVCWGALLGAKQGSPPGSRCAGPSLASLGAKSPWDHSVRRLVLRERWRAGPQGPRERGP